MRGGSIYIILDENQILDDSFYREVDGSHLMAIRKFSDYYHLDYKFEDDEYHEAPCMLALDGHLVVKIDNTCSNLILYLPEEVTDRQDMWIYEKKEDLLKYSMIGGYKLKKNDGIYNSEDILGLDNIIREADLRNLIYNKRKDDCNVRKKI